MANGYVQVKVVSTGSTILASDHNDECEALEDAFDITTGHNHDGSVGGGAPIPTAGLDNLTNTSAGITVADGANAFLVRTLTGTANEITVTNGTGVSGNPTLSLPSALTFTGKTITGGTFSSPTLTGTPIADVLQTSGSSGVAIKNSGGTTVLTVGSANTTNSTFAGAVNINGSEAVTSISNTQTLTNKTINLTNNTLTGTKAQFDAACSDDNFAYTATANTFTAAQSINVAAGVPLTITNTGSGNCLLVEDSTSTDTTPTVIDASGRLVCGNPSAISVGAAFTARIQAMGSGDAGFAMLGRFEANASDAKLNFLKSRNATPGSFTIVQSGDAVGGLAWYADDGVDYNNAVAAITATISTTPGADDTPGQLDFRTTADGANTTTSRMTIDHTGAVRLPTISTTASAANAFLDSGSSNNILRSTSSLRYKRDVETLADDFSEKIYEMRPVWYRSKAEADNPDWSYFGLIAEEMAEIEPRLVHFTADEDGNRTVPDGIQYERLTVLLLKEVQKLRAEINELKGS